VTASLTIGIAIVAGTAFATTAVAAVACANTRSFMDAQELVYVEPSSSVQPGDPSKDTESGPTPAAALATPPLTPTPRLTPTSTPKPGATVAWANETSAVADAISKSAVAALTLLLLLGVPVVALLARIYRCIGRQLGWTRPNLRLQALQVIGGKREEDDFLRIALLDAFARLRLDMDLLERQVALPIDQLRGLGLYRLFPSAVAEAAGLGVKVGPLEVNNVRRFWEWLTGQHDFILVTVQQADPAKTSNVHLLSVVALGETLVWTARRQANVSDLESTILDLARQVAWVISRRDVHDVANLSTATAPEIQVMRGLHLLADYIRQPESIAPLTSAAEYFADAGRASETWAFQAGLLGAIVLQLTQTEPGQTVTRMRELIERHGASRDRQLVIKYNLAQAHFYEYSQDSYRQAIELFREIPRPYAFLWNLRVLWQEVLKLNHSHARLRYQLYCLAQCNLAIVLAHQIDRAGTPNSKRALAANVGEIIASMEKELDVIERLLGPAVREVNWRIDNAKVVIALFLREKLDEAITMAEAAAQVVPYALDVKANLGSLNLLKAAEYDGQVASLPEFQKSVEIFESLDTTGWDPGFVSYRLGAIRRVQGSFEEAEKLLKRANDPKIKDVPTASIERQLIKAQARNSSLGHEDL
jgi:tetratricopeptide (TPR) repeat protein